MKAVLRWPVVWEVAQIDSGRYASFLSRMTIYTLSIVGALFCYMKRWNISLQSGGLEQMALTLYVFDGIRGMLSLDGR